MIAQLNAAGYHNVQAKNLIPGDKFFAFKRFDRIAVAMVDAPQPVIGLRARYFWHRLIRQFQVRRMTVQLSVAFAEKAAIQEHHAVLAPHIPTQAE
jgi:hypothetical protein